MQAIKLFSLLFLIIFFSTNYYGGNSLYFLTSDLQYIVKIISGVLGCVLLLLYFSLKNKHKRELVEINGFLYTKEALTNMEEYKIVASSVEATIKEGHQKIKNQKTYYTHEIKEGLSITVVLNNLGHIINVI